MRPEPDPDAKWVQALSGAEPIACASALAEANDQRRLFRHLKAEHDQEGRRSYVEIDAPLELHALVRLLRPAHVMEVGVSSGVSSAYLLNAMELNGAGTLHSVDLPANPASGPSHRKKPGSSWTIPPGRASGWAVPFGLRKRWDLRLGDKAEVLPLLARELRRVELFVYDVPHEDGVTREEFRSLDGLLPPGGVVIVDHGPNGGRCPALAGWARARKTHAVGRRGLGLYGMRLPGMLRRAATGQSRSTLAADH